jgi:hypothetical protein
MDYNELLKQVSGYVTSFYTKETDTRLTYHNYTHTWEMMDVVNRIMAGLALDDRSRFVIHTAIWFYDTGYAAPGNTDHKSKSADLAETFLKSAGADENDIAEIKKCILNTTIPQQPITIEQQIVCDTVMNYFGSDLYSEKSKQLKKETEALHGLKIGGEEWRKKSISLMENHHYFTDYAQANFTKIKLENLNQLKRKEEKKEEKKAEKEAKELLKKALPTPVPVVETQLVAPDGHLMSETPPGNVEVKKIKKKKEKAGRGLDTLFRIAATNHQRLSSMADNKAHIMISVNSIVISVLLGLIIRKLDKYDVIIIPTIIMLLVNVATIVFAVLATRPRVPHGMFTIEQVEKKNVDLTFFGNFYKMDFSDYEKGMKKLMTDSEFIYGSLIRNVYGQAKVLGKKFKFLQISYNIFMVGITVAVVAYALTFIFFAKGLLN